MTNNSFGRIMLLLKGDWMINRKQHGFIAIIFLMVVWFLELVPLAFSESIVEWKSFISSIEPPFIHFYTARILYLFVFLSWVSRTLYRPRIQHFYLIPISLREKYILLLIQGVLMNLLAIVVAFISLIPHLVLLSPREVMDFSHIVLFYGSEIPTLLDCWQFVLSMSFVSILVVGLFFFRILIRNQVIATLAAISSFILVFLMLLPLIVETPLENYIGANLYDNIYICMLFSGMLLLVDVAIYIGGYYVFKKKQIQ